MKFCNFRRLCLLLYEFLWTVRPEAEINFARQFFRFYYNRREPQRGIGHNVTFEFVKEVIRLVVTTNTTKSFPYFTILVFVQEGSRPMITGFDLRTSHLSPTIIVVKHDKWVSRGIGRVNKNAVRHFHPISSFKNRTSLIWN